MECNSFSNTDCDKNPLAYTVTCPTNATSCRKMEQESKCDCCLSVMKNASLFCNDYSAIFSLSFLSSLVRYLRNVLYLQDHWNVNGFPVISDLMNTCNSAHGTPVTIHMQLIVILAVKSNLGLYYQLRCSTERRWVVLSGKGYESAFLAETLISCLSWSPSHS